MNILLLTHSYPDKKNSWRGSFVRDQAKALSDSNSVIVIYFKIDYDHFRPFSKADISKIIAGNLTEYTITVNRSFPVFNQVNYLFRTYRFIKREVLSSFKPDIIHSHLVYPAGFLGTILQRRLKIPGVSNRAFEDFKLFQKLVSQKVRQLFTCKNLRHNSSK